MSDPADQTVRRVTLDGEYDIARLAELRAALLDAHDGEHRVEVDMARVTFLDSTSLSALLEARNALLERNATLIVTDASPTARRLFDITGTDEVLGLGPPKP